MSFVAVRSSLVSRTTTSPCGACAPDAANGEDAAHEQRVRSRCVCAQCRRASLRCVACALAACVDGKAMAVKKTSWLHTSCAATEEPGSADTIEKR
eukprot:6184347-Pleurochrysis_carterae.AAC.2